MQNQFQKRQIAYKLQIKHLLENPYHQQEGWNPNYLQINDLKVSRVNLIAVVVSKEQNNFILDDGTGQITTRLFEPMKNDQPEIGETCLIIARIREYNSQKYLVPEIIKKIKNPQWIQVRKLELKNFTTTTKPVPEKTEQENLAPVENLLNLIKKLDQGSGADVDDLIKQSTLPDCEKMIEELLKEGDIFEISPGKIKILK